MFDDASEIHEYWLPFVVDTPVPFLVVLSAALPSFLCIDEQSPALSLKFCGSYPVDAAQAAGGPLD